MAIYIILGIIVIIFIYILIIYNSFINSRNLVKEAFSTMDIYLKKRWDIIPNLVEVVKGYSDYEKETLIQITSLRNANYDELSMDNKIDINEKISKYLSNILAISENYTRLQGGGLQKGNGGRAQNARLSVRRLRLPLQKGAAIPHRGRHRIQHRSQHRARAGLLHKDGV